MAIFKKLLCKLSRIKLPYLAVTMCLFILFTCIVSPAYGIKTINGTISVEQDEENPLDILYIINLSALVSTMPVTSINLFVGSDGDNTVLSNKYTLKDSLYEDRDKRRVDLIQNSYKSIQIPVDFSSSELNGGDFASWISDENKTDDWDKAWYLVEVIPLVGDPWVRNVTGKPLFPKHEIESLPEVEDFYPPFRTNGLISKHFRENL